MGRILTLIILAGLAWSHFHSLDDQQEGVMVGILLGLSLMTIRYNLALRREENFEKLYIQVTDERNRMIDEKTRTLLFKYSFASGSMLERFVYGFSNHLKSQSVSDLDHYLGFGTLLSFALSPVQALLQKSWRRQLSKQALTELVFIFYRVDHTGKRGPW